MVKTSRPLFSKVSVASVQMMLKLAICSLIKKKIKCTENITPESSLNISKLITEKHLKFSALSFCKRIFLHQTPSCIFLICLHYVCEILDLFIKSCGKS